MKTTSNFQWSRYVSRSFVFPVAVMSFAAFTLGSCSGSSEEPGDEPGNDPVDTETAELAFRNSVDQVPEGWNGPVFELSHNYPTELPAGGDDMPWLHIDVDFNDRNPDWNTGQWREYMEAIIDYAFEGQDQNLTNESGWKVNVGENTRWFHVPWMAYNTKVGREFIHGCTSERIASIGDLDGDIDEGLGMVAGANSGDITQFETWAVGMYNDYAGYSFSQLFPETGVPTLENIGGRELPKGLPFNNGSMVIKTLFTTATPAEVPYLINAPTWTVNRHDMEGNNTYLCSRSPQQVHLVQVDVAVVDPRSPTNWVFGTFAYNGTLPGATAKERLDPVGIQYAMDPETFPAVQEDQSIPAFQSVLNEDIDIYEHFGCHGRLCGPVDNPEASCMSCHGGAYTAPMDELDQMGVNIPAIFGFGDMCTAYNDTNIAYFSNVRYPEPYPRGMFPTAIPLDFSLQVQVAFSEYKQYAIEGNPGECKPSVTD